jgi:cytidyltransferase-like protein
MRNALQSVIVSGAFDDLRSQQIRLLEEAAKLGELTVLLWDDEDVRRFTGKSPTFPLPERQYFLNAVRYVGRVVESHGLTNPDTLPNSACAEIWADVEGAANSARQRFAAENQFAYSVIRAEQLHGFPAPAALSCEPGRKKVVVTGSFDWFHSGHVRFFEEVSGYGDLTVVVGHDANIRLLKGEGHPLLSQQERRYLVGSIKFVQQTLISSGDGWLDADPEIQWLKPDIYAVNEDGDTGGKREYCEQRGIEYLVLKRLPADGLPKRSSTDLRGF